MAGTLSFPSSNSKQSYASDYEIKAVQLWIETTLRSNSDGLGSNWQVVGDEDGSIYLTNPSNLEPPLSIVPMDGHYVVLVCDPDDMDELGPFLSLQDALNGIVGWLSMPRRHF